ncbi:uncharacterized protein LOC124921786 [Impatiens glandulifera]|uniref:uncharacterized protein LOC124921786 n=1 Tax=Impatiens glandulifera TaxID=253017 RepID=UPI001FB117B1|nr:uncharacterized protein LOC124921786 [Impatiens glandulifera]
MGSSPTTIGPLLLRNIITSIFIFIDRYLLPLTTKFKFLHILRSLFISSFLFFLRLLPSLFPCLDPSSSSSSSSQTHLDYPPPIPPPETTDLNSGIARALTQLLAIVSNLPVNSRKYEVVRSLTDRLLDENLQVGSEALRQVNCSVLSMAFTRTLRLLDAAVWGEVGEAGEDYWSLNRVMKSVKQYGAKLINEEQDRFNASSAEKVAAELLWLAERMAACGCVQKAVSNWGSATRLARMALSVQPRLQGSLVKISAFLFKQVKDMKGIDEDKKEKLNESKMKMLMSWLPLLCRASNGTDAPILSVNERMEVERSLEETIEKLEGEDEQEKVLSLWLHYFTHCPSSDWPDLYSCYIRWCHASRNSLVVVPAATAAAI